MENEDITILIQGPLNDTSLSNISEYLKFGNVLISTWMEEETPLPKLDIPIGKEKNVKLVSQKLPPKNEWDARWQGAKQDSTFPWAWQSTMAGLQTIETKYTIKTRSDEKFVNLQPMIDLHKKTDKLIWGNIWAKIWDKQPHHIGDHIFMDKTERLLDTYRKIYESIDLNVGAYSAEAVLSISYMRNLGLNPDSKEDAMSVYEIMDIDEFDDWVIRHGKFKLTFCKRQHTNLNRNASSYGLPHHHDDCKDTIEFFRDPNFKLSEG